MTKCIHRYEVPLTGESILHLPIGAEILSVQVQGTLPVMWALVDLEMPTCGRRFLVVQTGQTIEQPREYLTLYRLHHLGTVQLDNGWDGRTVFHVFEWLSLLGGP